MEKLPISPVEKGVTKELGKRPGPEKKEERKRPIITLSKAILKGPTPSPFKKKDLHLPRKREPSPSHREEGGGSPLLFCLPKKETDSPLVVKKEETKKEIFEQQRK